MTDFQHTIVSFLLVKEIEDRVDETGQQNAARFENAGRLAPDRAHIRYKEIGTGVDNEVKAGVVKTGEVAHIALNGLEREILPPRHLPVAVSRRGTEPVLPGLSPGVGEAQDLDGVRRLHVPGRRATHWTGGPHAVDPDAADRPEVRAHPPRPRAHSGEAPAVNAILLRPGEVFEDGLGEAPCRAEGVRHEHAVVEVLLAPARREVRALPQPPRRRVEHRTRELVRFDDGSVPEGGVRSMGSHFAGASQARDRARSPPRGSNAHREDSVRGKRSAATECRAAGGRGPAPSPAPP